MKKLLFLGIVFLIGFCVVGGNSFAESNIVDFEIEIEMENSTKYDIEYEVRGNKIEAKYAVPGSVTLHGKNAVEVIEPLFQQLSLKPDINLETLKANVLTMFEINEDYVNDFEIEVKFNSDEKIKINN